MRVIIGPLVFNSEYKDLKLNLTDLYGNFKSFNIAQFKIDNTEPDIEIISIETITNKITNREINKKGI